MRLISSDGFVRIQQEKYKKFFYFGEKIILNDFFLI